MLNLTDLSQIITSATKLVSLAKISNALGTHISVEPVIAAAHAVGARVLVDASQAVAHESIDVKKMNCDFLVFSGHKMFAPTGAGILFIKKELQITMEPYQFGGGMVYQVSSEKAVWQKGPQRFEAGSPSLEGVVGLGAAIDFINTYLDFAQLKEHEAALCSRLINGLIKMRQVHLLGPVDQLRIEGHIVSFVMEDIHPHDVATYLSNHGICVRAGHHCAQPLAHTLGIESSVRVSFACYNTSQEVDVVLETLKRITELV